MAKQREPVGKFIGVTRELRTLLDAGWEPEELAERIGEIIDTITGDIEQQRAMAKDPLARMMRKRRKNAG